MILLFFLTADHGFSQVWSGLHIHSSPAYDLGESIFITENDEKYVVGTYQYNPYYQVEDPIRIGCKILPESDVIPLYWIHTIGVVIKYNSNDSIEWVRSVPMRAEDIAVDSLGNYFVSGWIDTDFYLNEEVVTVGGNQGLVMAYSREGDVLWHKRIRAGTPTVFSSSTALFHSLDIQKNGNVIVSGRSNIPGTLLPDELEVPSGGFIFRFDGKTGSTIDYYDMIGVSAEVFEIHVDVFDNILIGGTFDTFVFAGDSYGAKDDYDSFIAKFDSNFNEEWAMTFESDNPGFIEAIRSISSDGAHVYFGSFFSDDLYIGFNPVLAEPSSESDIWLACATNNGNLEWIRSIPGSNLEVLRDIEVNEDFIYISGRFNGQLQASPTITAEGNWDLFILKLRKSSQIEHGLRAGSKKTDQGSPSEREDAKSIALDSHNNLYVVGSTFSDGEFGDYRFTTSGPTDFFYARVSLSHFSSPPLPVVNCPPIFPDLDLYPNPASTEIFLRTVADIEILEIFDLTGQKIWTPEPVIFEDGIALDVSRLSAGYYILKIITKTGERNEKFLKIN